MTALILGGSASGKSEYAEGLAQRLGGTKIYLATLEPLDEESRRRVERHRRLREKKGFLTLERSRDLGGVELPPHATVLLECMGTLAANELFAPGGGGKQAALEGIRHLWATAEHLVLVSNSVFGDGVEYDPGTRDYLEVLGAMSREGAALADQVTEVVCGIPIQHKKGKTPCSNP